MGPNSGNDTEGTPGNDVIVTKAEDAGSIRTYDGDDLLRRRQGCDRS